MDSRPLKLIGIVIITRLRHVSSLGSFKFFLCSQGLVRVIVIDDEIRQMSMERKQKEREREKR